MAYGFNVAQYLPGREGLNWDTLNRAIAAIKQRRHEKELQEQAQAHAAQQNELQRRALAEAARVAAENVRQAQAAENERKDAQAAAAAAGRAMLAEQEGLPGEADAIVAAAAPTGLRVQRPPLQMQVPQTALRMPEMRAGRRPQVAPEQAMAGQLRQPMTAPGTQSALWDAIMRERGRLSLGDQGRQIGALGQDVAALQARPEAPPDVRMYTRRGGLLGQVDNEKHALMRSQRARDLLAPGALSSNPLAAEAAKRAQEAASAAAYRGPVDEAVKAAESTRKDELGLIGKDRAAELRAMGLQFSRERGQMQDEKTLFYSYDRELSRYATPAVSSVKSLDATYTRFKNASPEGKRALARGLAIALNRAAGEVGMLSNQDMTGVLDTQYKSYWEALNSWVESKAEGELPELVAKNLSGMAEGILPAAKEALEQYHKAMRQSVQSHDWQTRWGTETLKRLDGVFGRVQSRRSGGDGADAPQGEMDEPPDGAEPDPADAVLKGMGL